MIDLMLIDFYMICFVFCVGVFALVLAFPKRDALRKMLFLISMLTVCSGIAALGARYVSVYYPNIIYRKFLPVCTLWEGLLFFNSIILFICAAARFYKKFKSIFALSLVGMLFTNIIIFKASKNMALLSPPLQTWWMSAYSVSSVAGYAVLGISFLAGLLFMFRYSAGLFLGKEHGIFKRIPQSGALESLHSRFVFAGIPIMTIGIMLRSCWSNAAWGRWWLWNNEEIFSLIAWLMFVLYFHMYERSWQSKKTLVIISIIAYCIGFLSYFCFLNIAG